MDLLYETEGTGLLMSPGSAESQPISFHLDVFAAPATGASHPCASEQCIHGFVTSVAGRSPLLLHSGQQFTLRVAETDILIEITDAEGSFLLLKSAAHG